VLVSYKDQRLTVFQSRFKYTRSSWRGLLVNVVLLRERQLGSCSGSPACLSVKVSKSVLFVVLCVRVVNIVPPGMCSVLCLHIGGLELQIVQINVCWSYISASYIGLFVWRVCGCPSWQHEILITMVTQLLSKMSCLCLYCYVCCNCYKAWWQNTTCFFNHCQTLLITSILLRIHQHMTKRFCSLRFCCCCLWCEILKIHFSLHIFKHTLILQSHYCKLSLSELCFKK
jgi:hypothetical protein